VNRPFAAEADMAWFNVLFSFSFPLDFEYGFGPFLSWLSLFSVAVYFVTSSDSGSLIVDHLASNGFEDTHWLQRVFWAFTEGAVVSFTHTKPHNLFYLQKAV
jgi:choline-glycine betaine transporter